MNPTVLQILIHILIVVLVMYFAMKNPMITRLIDEQCKNEHLSRLLARRTENNKRLAAELERSSRSLWEHVEAIEELAQFKVAVNSIFTDEMIERMKSAKSVKFQILEEPSPEPFTSGFAYNSPVEMTACAAPCGENYCDQNGCVDGKSASQILEPAAHIETENITPAEALDMTVNDAEHLGATLPSTTILDKTFRDGEPALILWRHENGYKEHTIRVFSDGTWSVSEPISFDPHCNILAIVPGRMDQSAAVTKETSA